MVAIAFNFSEMCMFLSLYSDCLEMPICILMFLIQTPELNTRYATELK